MTDYYFVLMAASSTSPPPLVSVVVPVFDTPGEWLRGALASAFSQDCRFPFEILVCDDASVAWTPDTLTAAVSDVAEIYPWVSFQVLRRQTRGGPGPARNTAVEEARGKYLLWLDSDDELAPGAIDALVGAAVESGALLTVSQCKVFETHRTLLRDPTAYLDLSRLYWGTVHDPLVQVVFSIQAQLVDAQALRRAGGFDEQYKLAEVTELFQRLVRTVGIERVAVLDQPAYRYYRRPESYSTRHRDTFLTYRDEAIRAHATAIGLDVARLEFVGRSDRTGAQHYQMQLADQDATPVWLSDFAPYVSDTASLQAVGVTTPALGLPLSPFSELPGDQTV